MEIKLYNMGCEKNKINKTSYLLNEYICEGNLVEGTSYIRPSIRIQIENFGYNYVIIPQFGRAYFVDNIIVERTMIFRIDLIVDVLYTYRTDILSQTALINRTTNDIYSDEYLTDNTYSFANDVDVEDIFRTSLPAFDFISIESKEENNIVFNVQMISSDITFNLIAGEIKADYYLQIPSSAISGVNTFLFSYFLTASQLNKLALKCIENSEFASHIVSIKALPINAYNYTDILTQGRIVYNGEVIIDSVYFASSYSVNTTVRLGSFTINVPITSFKDFNPYTKYFIYLPFHGTVEIPSEYILKRPTGSNNSISIDILFNFANCELVYAIYTTTIDWFKCPIHTYRISIGTDIPVTSTNQQEINRTRESTGINNFAKVVTGASMFAAGIGTANPAFVLAGAGAIISSIIGGVAANKSIPDPSVVESGMGNTSISIYQPKQIIFYTVKRRVAGYGINIIGKPSNREVLLSGLYDGDIFTIYEMHLDTANSSITTGFYATSQELDEIISKLKDFCIK